MNKKELISKLTKSTKKVEFKLKKHSPEILVISGIIGIITSAVMACKATTKLEQIVEGTKETVNAINEAAENGEINGEEYTQEDSKKDIALVYVQTGIKFIKLYAPSVIVGVASIGSILYSHKLLSKRNIALAAAYTAVDKGFKDYRNNVIERFGKELDKELRFNIKEKKFEEKIIDENGKEKAVKKKVSVADENEFPSIYAKCYDDGCNGWCKDPELNLQFLRNQQDWANERLKAEGYLFLNDVYEMLGFPKTAAGQVVGWVFDNPNGDGFVDFGIYDLHNERKRAFVNGYERNIWIDPNVDGNILDLM